MTRKYKTIKGGSDYGPGTSAPETQGYTNDATDAQQDAANAGNADGEQLNNLNNLTGGKRRRHQRGGSEQVKAISVDSPARETAAGEYTAENQVSSNQEVV